MPEGRAIADGYWLIFKCAVFVVIAVIVALVTFGVWYVSP